MKIAKNKVASLAYELEVEGKIADKAGKEQPLEYIHGTHMLLPRFEEEVEGKEPGEKFEFTLSAEEGYGAYKPEYKFDLPKSAFEVNGVLQEQILQPGNLVPMLDRNGNVVRGLVAAVSEDKVSMDFNHPMAGKTLHFSGEVVAVRDASEEELTNGLHGEYKPLDEDGKRCSGKHGEADGCCGDDCGGDCDCGEGCCGDDCGCGGDSCDCKN